MFSVSRGYEEKNVLALTDRQSRDMLLFVGKTQHHTARSWLQQVVENNNEFGIFRQNQQFLVKVVVAELPSSMIRAKKAAMSVQTLSRISKAVGL